MGSRAYFQWILKKFVVRRNGETFEKKETIKNRNNYYLLVDMVGSWKGKRIHVVYLLHPSSQIAAAVVVHQEKIQVETVVDPLLLLVGVVVLFLHSKKVVVGIGGQQEKVES